MKGKVILAVFAAFVLCVTAKADPAATPVKADDGMPPASSQEQIDKMDQGPDTIDVSKYKDEKHPEINYQDYYLVFAAKCSKCHTLARPINSPYALAQEWKTYVTKMSHKPRSGISDDDAKKIIAFLTYDSSVRKTDIIAQKKAKKTPPKN